MTAENTNKKFRMVALDLDGTLLNSNHALSDATIAHLRRLHAKGFIVSIATGRSAACTAHIIEKLDLSPGSSTVVDNDESLGFPLVCTNGARGLRIRKSHSDVGHSHATNTNSAPHRSNTVPLDNNSSKNTNNPTNPFLKQSLIINDELFHNPLSRSLTLKTLALAHRLGCVTNYYHNHHIYAVARNQEQLALTKRYAKLTGSNDLYRYLNEKEEDESNTASLCNEENGYGYQKAIELGPPSKLLILCDTNKLEEITTLVRTELNGTNDAGAANQQANVIRGTPPFFVEILNPGVHKGQGLRQLCQSLSVPLDEVIAFGDSDNDLEFIQMAGWGVAMKNARSVVKEKADEVAKWSNDEDGVIKTLQQYELEGKLHFP
mmetsp:Transcript_32188/g.67685  ORF Transcript_32188/g.67685 Transcript_32188/m.67685 type:complete len:377 (+) Transcript_32188:170-1300(+)